MFKIFYKEIIDSTNIWAKEESITDAIFISNQQTMGKGRLNRKWISPKSSNLYFSIKMRVENFIQANHYNFITSIAIVKAIKKLYDFKVVIKWPNDLLINNKKFAGILSEIDNKRNLNIIIGIGINCFFDTRSGELNNIATSLHYYIKNLDKDILFNEIVNHFKILNLEYKEKGFKYILKQWNNYAKIDEREIYTTVYSQKEKVRVIKLNNDGSIMVKRRDGEVIKLIAEDIEYVKKSNNKKFYNN